MPSISFVSGTVIPAVWLNDIDATTYETVPALDARVTALESPGSITAAQLALDAQIQLVPVGAVQTFATPGPPPGWLAADGSIVSRVLYNNLYFAIGTAFGAGDGVNTFQLPDLRNKMAIGSGSLYNVGDTGGSKDAVVVSHTHTATVTDPGHTHTQNGGTATPVAYGSGGDYASSTSTPITGSSVTGISVSNSTTGVSGTNANLPPYVALLTCIKY